MPLAFHDECKRNKRISLIKLYAIFLNTKNRVFPVVNTLSITSSGAARNHHMVLENASENAYKVVVRRDKCA